MATVVKDAQVGRDGLQLIGAPDLDIGNTQEQQNTPRAVQLNLSPAAIEEIKKAAQSDKSVQVLFGKAPSLRIGDVTRPLHLSSAPPFRYEVYRRGPQEPQRLEFAGLVSHRAAVQEAREATKGAEDSLMKLQASLAQHEKEKQDNSAMFIGNQSPAGNSTKRLNKTAANKPMWKKKSGLFESQATSRSLPTSPSLLPSQRIAHSTSAASPPQPPRSFGVGPTSVPAGLNTSAASDQAHRFALFHFLALRPATESQIVQSTGISKDDLDPLLEKHAYRASPTDPWKLIERRFKDLNVWEFPYSSQTDRQDAIDNAVRAFDHQRISPRDKLWDLLLPKQKRNKGIVLSKLKLGSAGASSSQVNGSPALTKDKHHSAGESDRAAPTAHSSAEHLKSEMAPARSSVAKKANATSKPAKTPAAKSAPTKKLPKNKQPQTTDFGDENEGSSDLDEVISGLNSEADKKKSKAQTNAARPKAPAAGTKRKSDSKFKSEEYIHDSSELIEDDEINDDDDDDDKPLAETRNERPPHKRQKLEHEPSKSKPAQEPRSTNPAKTKKPAPPVDKSLKGASYPKHKPHSRNPSADVTKASDPKASLKQKAAGAKDDLKSKGPSHEASPPTPKAKHENASQAKNKVEPAKGGSSFFSAYPPKSGPKHQHSSSLSSRSSSGVIAKSHEVKKQTAENHSSPETFAKKRKFDGALEKAATLSSSPLTNASDLPTLSSPEGLTPRSNGSLRGSPGENSGAAASSPAVSARSAQAAGQTGQKTLDSTVTNGVHPSTADSPGQGSPNDGLIAGLKEEYSKTFKDHIAKHLTLDQAPAETAADDKAEHNAKFEELKALSATIRTLLRRSGRGEEVFPDIPDDFSAATVPGFIEYARSKISKLSEWYSAEHERYTNGEQSEERKSRLNVVYDEIQQLQELCDH